MKTIMVKDSEEWKDDYEKSVTTGMRNQMFRLRVSKREKWEALLVARTQHQSMLDRTSDVFGLIIGAVNNITREGVV